jgi:hypothetical protein
VFARTVVGTVGTMWAGSDSRPTISATTAGLEQRRGDKNEAETAVAQLGPPNGSWETTSSKREFVTVEQSVTTASRPRTMSETPSGVLAKDQWTNLTSMGLPEATISFAAG